MTSDDCLAFLKGKIMDSDYELAEYWLRDRDRTFFGGKRNTFEIEKIFQNEYRICKSHNNYSDYIDLRMIHHLDECLLERLCLYENL